MKLEGWSAGEIQTTLITIHRRCIFETILGIYLLSPRGFQPVSVKALYSLQYNLLRKTETGYQMQQLSLRQIREIL